MERYTNRQEAGRVLASYLEPYSHAANTLLLALPRGGVPVAFEVSQALHLPMDVYIIRKLGVPSHQELAFGAIAPDDTIIYNQDIVSMLHLSQQQIDEVIHNERKELLRREKTYRKDKPRPILKDKTIILIDDGVATGASIRAAIQSIRLQRPKKLIVAVPVGAKSTCIELNSLVDELICPLMPDDLYAVGYWYEDFTQTSDEEVIERLNTPLKD